MCTVLLPPGDNPIAFNKYISYGHHQFESGDSTWCKLQITKLLTAYFSPTNFQMAERGKPKYTKILISIFECDSVVSWKVHKYDGPDLWADMIRNYIRSNFPGRVPILWGLKHSVPVSHKIWLGTPNIWDFKNHKDFSLSLSLSLSLSISLSLSLSLSLP